MTKYFYDLTWTFNNLIHLLIGDEKKLTVEELFFYIASEMALIVENLYETELTENVDTFQLTPNVSYVSDLLMEQIYNRLNDLPKGISNTKFNSVLKEEADKYISSYSENQLKKYLAAKGV